MFKKVFVFVIMSCFMAQSALAKPKSETESEEKSDAPERSMAFTVNPLQMIFLTLSGEYMLGVSNRVALVFPLNITYLSANITYGTQSKSSKYIFGIGSGLGVRFHLTAPRFQDGVYVQPGVNVGWLKFGDSGVNTILINPYALLGYSWVWDSGFMLNLAIGAQYAYMGIKAESSSDVFALHGFLPAGEFSLGYTW